MKTKILYALLIFFILLSVYLIITCYSFEWITMKPNINELINVEDLMEDSKDKEVREWLEGKTINVTGTIKYIGTEYDWFIVTINRDGNQYSQGGLICMFEDLSVEEMNELRVNKKGDEILITGIFINKDFYDYLIIGDCDISKY